jgi:transcriptional regulator CtsR
LDLDGNFIKRWNSIKEAMSAGYNNINYVINGKYKQSKGYKWEYARD